MTTQEKAPDGAVVSVARLRDQFTAILPGLRKLLTMPALRADETTLRVDGKSRGIRVSSAEPLTDPRRRARRTVSRPVRRALASVPNAGLLIVHNLEE